MELVSKEELTKNLECVYKNDQKMIDWSLKNIDFASKLRNKIVTFYKPHIEKNFCFGFDERIEGDIAEAHKQAEIARNNFEYFKRKNLYQIGNEIAKLEDKNNNFIISKKYWNESGDFVGINYVREFDIKNTSDLITDDERKEYIEAYKLHKERFSKRIDTYLKKYGLKKVHSWTYSIWD